MQKMEGNQGPPPPGFAAPPPSYMPPPPYSAVQPPYNPGQQQQQQQQQQPTTGQPTIIVVQSTCFGPDPQGMSCPYCRANIVTRVESGPTAMTHLAFLMCFIFICWPCAPFVYCTDGCLARKHYCPNCNRLLGQNGC